MSLKFNKKRNNELIRKSLNTFERSFHEILGDKSKPTSLNNYIRSKSFSLSKLLYIENVNREKETPELIIQNLEISDELNHKLFSSKRMSASSCVNYKSLRDEKKINQKNHQIFNYRSQNSSFERDKNGISFYKTKGNSIMAQSCFHHMSHQSKLSYLFTYIDLNNTVGLKRGLDTQQKSNLSSTINLRHFSTSQSSNYASNRSLNQSRKTWLKK